MKSFIHKCWGKYKRVFIFSIILLFLGIAMGGFLSKHIEANDIKQLKLFLNSIEAGNNPKAYFHSQLLFGVGYVIILFLFGTSIFGSFIISILLFIKGIQIGFSCILFIASFHMKGIVGILLALMPQMCLDLIITLVISCAAIQQSYYILYASVHNERLDYKNLFNYMLNIVLVCIGLVFADSYIKSTFGIACIHFFNGL